MMRRPGNCYCEFHRSEGWERENGLRTNYLSNPYFLPLLILFIVILARFFRRGHSRSLPPLLLHCRARVFNHFKCTAVK